VKLKRPIGLSFLMLCVLYSLWTGPWLGSICWKRFLFPFKTFSSGEYWEKYSGCINTYLIQNLLSGWTEHGIRSRGFLGLVARSIFGQSVSVDVLNMFWILVSLLLLLVVLTFLLTSLLPRQDAFPSWVPLAICAAYILGPGFTINVENIGDPLQLCLLTLGAFIFLVAKSAHASKNIGIYFVLTMIIMTLIHESVLFIVFPAFCLLLKEKVAKSRLYCITYLAFTVVYLATCFTVKHLHEESQLYQLASSFHAFNWRYPQETLIYRAQDSLNLQFSSSLLSNPFKSLGDFIDAWLWPLVFGLTLVLFMDTRRVKVFIRVFVISMLSSLPLYLLATDWGRFAALQLGVIICVTAGLTAKLSRQGSSDICNYQGHARLLHHIGLRNRALLNALPVLLILITIKFWPATDHMTFSGIQPQQLLPALRYLSVYLLAVLYLFIQSSANQSLHLRSSSLSNDVR